MFSFHLPFRKTPPPACVEAYLKQIKWNATNFTNEALQGKLVSAMCKYLSYKITDIQFILELSEEIRKKQGKKMNSELSSITTILYHLSKKIQKKEIDLEDTKNIRMIINRTQQIVTGKSFLN